MNLVEVQAHIKTMTLKQFVVRRLKDAFSAFGNVYEFRSVNGSKWYPIHRLHMMFPKLDPDVSSYVRQLFDRLNQGEEVTVQAEYSKCHMKGKLLIVPNGTPEEREPGTLHKSTIHGERVFPLHSPVSSPLSHSARAPLHTATEEAAL